VERPEKQIEPKKRRAEEEMELDIEIRTYK
jgi:hypothetical protein